MQTSAKDKQDGLYQQQIKQWIKLTFIEHYTNQQNTYSFQVPMEHVKVDIMLIKTKLNIFKKVEIIQDEFFNHPRIKLEISTKKITGKSLKSWKLKNTFLNNPRVKEEVPLS